MDITVKQIPETVYLAIKREAQNQRRSLNSQIIHALQEQAQELERRSNLSALRKKIDRFANSLPALDSSLPLIRQDRRR